MKTKDIMVPEDIFPKYEIMTAIFQDFEGDWNSLVRFEFAVRMYPADCFLVRAIDKMQVSTVLGLPPDFKAVLRGKSVTEEPSTNDMNIRVLCNILQVHDIPLSPSVQKSINSRPIGQPPFEELATVVQKVQVKHIDDRKKTFGQATPMYR